MLNDAKQIRRPRDIYFEPVRDDHLPMLFEWLSRPHMREWWGDPEKELGLIRDMVEGRDTTRPFIFLVDGEPTGYIQYWFVGDHQDPPWTEEEPWLKELPSDAIGIDLSIGDADKLSEGIGSSVLRRFVQTLLEQGYRRIIIDPDPENVRAVRAYKKAGFTPVREYAGAGGKTLLMKFDTKRPGIDT